MGYTRSAIAGFSWQTALKLVSAATVMVKVALLTRLLTPDQFGIFSMVMISLGLTEAFTQTGVNVTILQSQKPTSYFINSAWVIAIVRGFAIGLLMILVGSWLQDFFNEPVLLRFIVIAALIPVIKGFINPSIVNLQKELKFLADSSYRFSLVIIDSIVSVIAVWILGTVNGLILGMIVAALFEVALSFIALRSRPRFRLERGSATHILKNAKGLTLSSLLTYLNENADNLLIGRLVGTFKLGIYQPTYGLCHVPNYELARSANHGTLPIYSRLGNDTVRLTKAFLKASGVTLALGLVASLPLIIMPQVIIPLVFGDQWQSAIPLTPWLAVAGILQALTMVFYSLFYARNYLKTANVHSLLTFVTLIAGIWYLTPLYGLLGAVWGVIASRVIGIPILIWGAYRTLKANHD